MIPDDKTAGMAVSQAMYQLQFGGAPLSKKQFIRGILGFIPIAVAELIEKRPEIGFLFRRDLDADQHAAIVGAVIAVMEQADVPVVAHVVEEVHQCAGAVGKFKPVNNFILDRMRPSADQMTHVQFGHFVVAHVLGRQAALFEFLD